MMSTRKSSRGSVVPRFRLATVMAVAAACASPMSASARQNRDAKEAPSGRVIKKYSQEIARVPPADVSPSYRHADPTQVLTPPGYVVEVYANALDFPVDIAFSDDGDAYIAEAGFHGLGTDLVRAPSPQIVQIRADGTKLTVYENTVPVAEVQREDTSERMPEGIIPPIKGITWRNGKLYIAHRSRISVLDLSDEDPDTRFKTIVNGLPEWGAPVGGKPIFDRDGKLVFFVPAQGNAGVVDEQWAAAILQHNKLMAHDIPGEDVTLTGKNFHVPLETAGRTGMYIRAPDQVHTTEIDERTAKVPYEHEHALEPPTDDAVTGALVPLWTRTSAGQVIKGQKICNGAFFRCDPDGSNLERIAWGFRSSSGYRFTPDGRLICTHTGANPSGPRKLWFDSDAVYEVVRGEWYGWPDYYSGLPITDRRFAINAGPQEFLLNAETHRKLLNGRDRPQQPLLRLPPQTGPQGLVFGRSEFGVDPADILVAEMGPTVPLFKGPRLFYTPTEREEAVRLRAQMPADPPADADFAWPGCRVQLVDLNTGKAQDFLVNTTRGPASAARGGGLERPVQLEWGPDGALYVVDFGIITALELDDGPVLNSHVRTGVIWRVRRAGARPLRTGG